MIDDVIPNLGAYKTIRVRKRTKLAITPNDKIASLTSWQR